MQSSISKKKKFERSEEENMELSASEYDMLYLLLELEELLPRGSGGPAAGTSLDRARTGTGPQHRQLQRLDRVNDDSDLKLTKNRAWWTID